MLPYIWKDGDILFRKDSNFYSRVDEKMKGNWRVIFFATILINIINMIVSSSNSLPRSLDYINSVMENGFVYSQFINYIQPTTEFNLLFSFEALLTELLTLTFNMELLDFLRTGVFQVENIVRYIIKHPFKVFSASLLLWLLPIATGLIPIFGKTIYYVLYYGFSYVAYLVLLAPESNPFYYLKLSWNLTNGNKIELLNKVIHYYGIVFFGYFIVGFGFFLLVIGHPTVYGVSVVSSLGVVTMIFGVIWSIFWHIKNTPYYEPTPVK